ncbi:MAG: phage GP46 family protein [Sneathiella sp.]
MPDIALEYETEALFASMSLDGADLKTGNELQTAVFISLFTWRRAKPDDILPDDIQDPQGWWGDTFSPIDADKIGSRLWLYRRKKITQQVILDLQEVCEEALVWLLDDNVAKAVEVDIQRTGNTSVGGTITITGHDGTVEALQFSDIWKVLNG